MSFSMLDHLECSRCHYTYDADTKAQLCPNCRSPLLVRYRLEQITTKPAEIAQRAPNLWRYHELLPVRNPEQIVSLGEMMTPLLPLSHLGQRLGLPSLLLKDEGSLPTGSFKARGAAVGISRAQELGVKTLAMPTNGNAGGAWAAYGARAGINVVIGMPETAPLMNRQECAILGAKLFLVNGLISDAGAIIARLIQRHGWYDASTLKEPYRIEGKKTMAYEIVEQLNWQVPDVILYPTGGGVGLIGIYKALREMQAIGWIGNKLPRLVAVQAEGCAPIVEAWREGKTESQFWFNAQTIAFGITVPKALGDFLILEAIRETNGCAIAVSDAEIENAQPEIAQSEGLFICPEGAATLAATRMLVKQGWIQQHERVVLLNTGTGLKYVTQERIELPVLNPQDTPDILLG